MSIDETYEQIRSAVSLDGERAVFRIRVEFQPVGGLGSKVYPPTYPAAAGESPYLLEQRLRDGEAHGDVVLDAVPAEANRAEEALLRAWRSGLVRVPMFAIEHHGDTELTLYSLEWPHRYADAYLRDSLLDSVSFDRTDIGKALLAASLDDATALYRHDPGTLVWGAWNSHRKGRQQKFPRVYSSEIVGWDAEAGRRKAGRMDPLNLQGAQKAAKDGSWEYSTVATKVKGEKLSEIGHGNVAPNAQHGGVTISSAERIATLSLAGLDRIGFGSASREAAVAARAALAAYALLGDRLAFGRPSIWLRSGCELVVESERIEWVSRGGGVEALELDVPTALALFEHARDRAAELGLPMELDTVRLTPSKALAQAIDFSLTKASEGDD